MTGQQLRDSILLAAFTGTFVDQNSEDMSIFTRVADINKEQKQLIAAKIIKKEKYDPTLSERDDNLPSNWKVVKLGDISKVITKQTGFDYSNHIKPNLVDTPGDDYIPMLQTRNFKGKSFNFNTEYYIPRKIASSFPKICLDEPCLLLSIVGASIGNVGYLEQPREAIIGGAICKVTLIPAEFYDYIYYFLQSPQGKSEITKNLKATAQGTIMVQDVREIEVPLPPYEEQKRIVAKIEELLPLVDEYDKAAGELKTLNEALPDKLRKSVLYEAIQGHVVSNEIPDDEEYGNGLLTTIKRKKEQLYREGIIKKSRITYVDSITDFIFDIPDNWIWCRLGDICHIAGRIGFRGYTKADIVSGGGAVSLSPSNIINGKIDFSHYTMISMAKYEESPEIMVSDGEIVFTKTASVGKCAYIENVPMPTTINPQMVVIKHIGCDARYLTYVLQSPYAMQNFNVFVKGTSIPTFSQALLESLLIPLPPLSIQKAIVAKIEEVFAAIDKLKA